MPLPASQSGVTSNPEFRAVSRRHPRQLAVRASSLAPFCDTGNEVSREPTSTVRRSVLWCSYQWKETRGWRDVPRRYVTSVNVPKNLGSVSRHEPS